MGLRPRRAVIVGKPTPAIDPSWFQQSVVQWYEKHGRKHLPWQKDRSPYRVWLSEIMLQQTQVKTVIPYFERFTQQFPDIQSLAKAPIDDVLSLWSGLGYYARARNIHKTAQIITQNHKGEFPRDTEGLVALPGIGRSTAGAIQSLAMRKSTPILDGNVKRVLIRSHEIEGWSGKREIENQLWSLSERCTPKTKCRQYNQAMMDIGATLCSRSKPQCEQCPLNSRCRALAKGRVDELPHRKPKTTLPTRHCQMLVISNTKKEVFLEKRPNSGLWGGLWSLPQIQLEECPEASCLENWQLNVSETTKLPPFRHTFSHFHLTIQPVTLQVKGKHRVNKQTLPHRWVKLSQLDELGLSSPVKKILIQQQTQ